MSAHDSPTLGNHNLKGAKYVPNVLWKRKLLCYNEAMLDRNIIFSPSILGSDFSSPLKALDDIMESGADYVHLDVMDGCFVPEITFGAKFIRDIRPHTDLVFDVHLMIETPERSIQSFLDAGAGIITIHAESTRHAWRALSMIHEGGVEAGIAINPGTPVSFIEPLLDISDYVLVMTVNPGWGGQSFIPETLKKVEELKALRDNLGYSYLIEVDGGISMQNIRKVCSKGADVIVTGSAFFKESDKKLFIQRMAEEAAL